jgi:hypothetical protein
MRNSPILILLLANTAFGEPPSWVAKSNQNAQVLLEIDARFNPESAGAQQPAPHMEPPRLIGNAGESGVFVLPLNVPGPPGENPSVPTTSLLRRRPAR